MRKRRVLVTGAAGQLGSALQAIERPDWDVIGLTSGQLDITHWQRVRDAFAGIAPDLVIHAAAATNVDRCEREPDWAYSVNALGSRYVAQAAAQVDATLVYVSTNYVFDGEKSGIYHEFDSPGPINTYGASKLAGELESRSATPRCFVIRTSSVYTNGPGNFVATMRRLMNELDSITVVDDQFSNPTYAFDLAGAIAQLVDVAPFGTYHLTNSGETSWHGWATAIKSLTGATCSIQPIAAIDYKRDARPPDNGTMTSIALPDLGITLPDWRDALQRCLSQWPA